MRLRISAATILAVALFASPADAQQIGKPVIRTPGSCDGKPATFHVKRARAIVRTIWDVSRIPDQTPAKRSEQEALHSHRSCVEVESLLKRIDRYRERKQRHYRHALNEDSASWCAENPHPDGGGCWVIPSSCVMAESGGSWTAANPSGAIGPYQLLGHGAPWPVTTRADAMAHHRIAAALYASQGLSPWVAPGC